MIKKINLWVIIFLFIACCNNVKVNVKKEITPNVSSKVTFKDLVENIPTLKLPYTFHCGLEESLPEIGNFEKRLIGYLPENVIIAGKIPIDNDLIYIVYGTIGDIIYPHLNIYNQNGERLDSIYLHISWCAADEWERVSTTTTINKDYSISMTDTTEYFVNPETFVTDSIVVRKKKLKLMNSGFYKSILFDSIKIQ